MEQIIEQDIAALISQSSAIAKHVRLENWSTVEELTQQRQQSLEVFFDTAISTKYAEPVEKMIRKIMELDHELIELIELEKKNTFTKFTHLKFNSKANKTYQNVASLNLP